MPHAVCGSSLSGRRLVMVALWVMVAHGVAVPAASAQHARLSDDLKRELASAGVSGLSGRSEVGESTASVILTGTAEQIEAAAARHGLAVKKRLGAGAVVEVSASQLARLAADTGLDLITGNHRVTSHMKVTNEALGATLAWASAGGPASAGRGVTGRGVGVAVIDSGIAEVPNLRSKVSATRDLVDPRGRGVDTWGHGTHVAGIIAAKPLGRDGVSGVAPGAHLINVRVLGADGSGTVADVIDGIEWLIANRLRLGVDVINLSLGAPPQQSWRDDPLCHAIAQAHRAGIVVVAAAGNRGRTDDGTAVYGTINSPGHCPHAITVGALNTNGTAARSDDVMATYSSKGPTRDGLIKPDVVAPGNKIVGLLAPGAALAAKHPELVVGSGASATLRLSGTSMSAAAVSGAVALLKEFEPRFRPPTIRLALQYSAQPLVGDGLLKAGAGSVNAIAALSMPYPEAAAMIAGESVPVSRLTFGIRGTTVAPAVAPSGTVASSGADNILWGDAADNILWGDAADNILWGDAADNILWGDATDNILWGDAADNILWGDAADNILWGDAADNILWGDVADNILWGDAAETSSATAAD